MPYLWVNIHLRRAKESFPELKKITGCTKVVGRQKIACQETWWLVKGSDSKTVVKPEKKSYWIFKKMKWCINFKYMNKIYVNHQFMFFRFLFFCWIWFSLKFSFYEWTFHKIQPHQTCDKLYQHLRCHWSENCEFCCEVETFIARINSLALDLATIHIMRSNQ